MFIFAEKERGKVLEFVKNGGNSGTKQLKTDEAKKNHGESVEKRIEEIRHKIFDLLGKASVKELPAGWEVVLLSMGRVFSLGGELHGYLLFTEKEIEIHLEKDGLVEFFPAQEGTAEVIIRFLKREKMLEERRGAQQIGRALQDVLSSS